MLYFNYSIFNQVADLIKDCTLYTIAIQKKFKQNYNSAKNTSFGGVAPVLWTPLLPFRSPKGRRKGQLVASLLFAYLFLDCYSIII